HAATALEDAAPGRLARQPQAGGQAGAGNHDLCGTTVHFIQVATAPLWSSHHAGSTISHCSGYARTYFSITLASRNSAGWGEPDGCSSSPTTIGSSMIILILPPGVRTEKI